MTNVIELLKVIAIIGGIFTTSYYALKPNIPAWNLRGFAIFQKSWHKIFLWSGVIGILLAGVAWWQGDYNPWVALIVGLIGGFFAIASWTDSIVHKVPSEISNLTRYFAFAIFVITVFGNVKLPVLDDALILTVPMESFGVIVGLSFLTMIIGLYGFHKIGSSAGWASLFIGFIGFFILGYTLISWLAVGVDNLYWNQVGDKLLLTFIFIAIVMLFDLFFGHLIGGADMVALYSTGFAFAWWVGSYNLFIFMLVACAVQAALHFLAKPIGIGEIRTVKNGVIRQAWENRKHKQETKALNSDKAEGHRITESEWKEISSVGLDTLEASINSLTSEIEAGKPIVITKAPTTHEAMALPFLPVLLIGQIGGILIALNLFV